MYDEDIDYLMSNPDLVANLTHIELSDIQMTNTTATLLGRLAVR